MIYGNVLARRSRLLGGAAMIGLVALAGLSPAIAQQAVAPAPQAQDADTADQEVVVTGSRLASDGFTAPSNASANT